MCHFDIFLHPEGPMAMCAMQQLTADEPSCNPVLVSELPLLKALKAVDVVTEKPLSAVTVAEYKNTM